GVRVPPQRHPPHLLSHREPAVARLWLGPRAHRRDGGAPAANRPGALRRHRAADRAVRGVGGGVPDDRRASRNVHQARRAVRRGTRTVEGGAALTGRDRPVARAGRGYLYCGACLSRSLTLETTSETACRTGTSLFHTGCNPLSTASCK